MAPKGRGDLTEGPKQNDVLRNEILERIEPYYQAQFPGSQFRPGETLIPTSGKVFDSRELACLVDAGLDFWLTTGRYASQMVCSLSCWAYWALI